MTRPNAGDLVRLTNSWDIVADGALGVINGCVGRYDDELEITWNCTIFRGFSVYGSFRAIELGLVTRPAWAEVMFYKEIVEAGGGPGVMFLDARLLKPTNDMQEVTCWCWRDMPRADSAVHYKITVPVWEWDGKTHKSIP